MSTNTDVAWDVLHEAIDENAIVFGAPERPEDGWPKIDAAIKSYRREAKIEGAKEVLEVMNHCKCPPNTDDVKCRSMASCSQCYLAAIERGEWPLKEAP